MKLKTGKEEILYLLTKVIEKFEAETGNKIIRNSNRKNYEQVARLLSEISNKLPLTSDTFHHEKYLPDQNPQNPDYPFRKYDITGNQLKDAYFNQIVANPRPFLVEACYIYLYGVGRSGFEKDPQDINLLRDADLTKGAGELSFKKQSTSESNIDSKKKISKIFLWLALIFFAAFLFVTYKWLSVEKEWNTIKKDMKILPYKPTQQEIDRLEGVWLCYTGSPQARISDSNRYHMVVSNVVNVKYKNGYFTFTRFGASFDHLGYMQFESPYLVSIYSYVENNSDSIESPRHSLMQLNNESKYISVISASWSFDVGIRNNIIGIREVYIKQGKGGYTEESMNTLENASCHCKIINWHQDNNQVKTFYLKNQLLDNIPDETLRNLLNENSILLRVPQKGLLTKDTLKK